VSSLCGSVRAFSKRSPTRFHLLSLPFSILQTRDVVSSFAPFDSYVSSARLAFRRREQGLFSLPEYSFFSVPPPPLARVP